MLFFKVNNNVRKIFAKTTLCSQVFYVRLHHNGIFSYYPNVFNASFFVNNEAADDGNPQRGPRHILVQLSSKAARKLIMDNLYKMKSLEAKFSPVIIAHDMTKADMTKAEREDCKALVDSAHTMSRRTGYTRSGVAQDTWSL